MPWARASALARHMACPAASYLPRYDRGTWEPGYRARPGVFVAPECPPDRSHDAADWGTAMHDAKAGHGVDPWESWMAPHRDLMWPPDMGKHEVCLAYDCRTREVIVGPANLPKAEQDAWKAQQGDDCVVGVTDWWGNLNGDTWIDDLKTGWQLPDVITPPMQFYLMCAAKVDGNRGGWLSITHMPKAHPSPTREDLWRKQTGPELDAFEELVHLAWLGVVGLSRTRPDWEPAPRPGMHCQYCPSASVCPRANE